jgi:hypothetical protein
MITRLLPVLLIAVVTVAGCQNQQKKTEEQSVTPAAVDLERVSQIRTMYQQSNPATQVGYINAALPGEELVSVVEIPVGDVKVNESIVFIDPQQNTIATGRVVAVVADALHVRYSATARAPGVGDIAVKFPR